MLNFLDKSTHPEISYAVHQCTRFCNDPKHSHEMAIHQIVKHLLSTQTDKSKFNNSLDPDRTKGIEVFVDASFAGDWNKLFSGESSSELSRTGFVIKHVGCPIF